jgi:hypothetical protein
MGEVRCLYSIFVGKRNGKLPAVGDRRLGRMLLKWILWK